MERLLPYILILALTGFSFFLWQENLELRQDLDRLVDKTAATSAAEHEETPELASYMGSLQRHTLKCGLAIQSGNKELVEFYLHEIEETLEEIEERIPEHDGIVIAKRSQNFMTPKLKQFDRSVDSGDWKRIKSDYKGLVAGCNDCHQATEHGFIRISPEIPANPYNQEF